MKVSDVASSDGSVGRSIGEALDGEGGEGTGINGMKLQWIYRQATIMHSRSESVN